MLLTQVNREGVGRTEAPIPAGLQCEERKWPDKMGRGDTPPEIKALLLPLKQEEGAPQRSEGS
jgi:hypothetical protein